MGNGLRYEIPKFQRDYTWESEQWDDLWQDIKDLLSDEDHEHYMGYLVLQTTDNRAFQIIDGQQRLTTMSLLGFMLGKDGVEKAFQRKLSHRFYIHRTRVGFENDGMDTFENMARKGIWIIDRVVQEEMKGGVDLNTNTWSIPAGK